MALLQRGILRLSGRKKKALSIIEVSYAGTKTAILLIRTPTKAHSEPSQISKM